MFYDWIRAAVRNTVIKLKGEETCCPVWDDGETQGSNTCALTLPLLPSSCDRALEQG